MEAYNKQLDISIKISIYENICISILNYSTNKLAAP